MESKTARLTLLIDPEKKKRFEQICASQDVTPSQVIRKFIREYIEAHAQTAMTPAEAPPAAGRRDPPAR